GGAANSGPGGRARRSAPRRGGPPPTADPARRMRILRDAEALLLDQGPFIPIYHYSVNDLVKPYVRGIQPTALDTHPMKFVWIDRDWNRAPAPPQAHEAHDARVALAHGASRAGNR